MKLQEFSSYLDKVRPIIESYPDKHSEQKECVSGHYVSVNYKEYLDKETKKIVEEYFFKITCLSPEIPIRAVTNEKPLSIILTSGTLQPFDSLEDELGI